MERILITPDEAKEMLGVGRSTMYKLCSEKGFPSMRIGSKVYIDKSLLTEWIKNKCSEN